MSATDYATGTTRPHWGGANSDTDIHLEVYQNEVDTKFQSMALFKSLSTQRSVTDKSNTYRIDRLGSSVVKSRTSGVALDSQRVVNEKMTITVDTVLYIRNPIDYQDDWTGPDFLTEMGQNNGGEFAAAFDQAHIVALQHCRTWTAPASLAASGAFHNGIQINCAQEATPVTQAELEANAIALEQAHAYGVETLITRKVPLTDMITICTVSVYGALKYHPKLVSTETDTVNGGQFGQRRVRVLNGIPVVEMTDFPTGAIPTALLGSAFVVTTDDVKCQMITFSKSRSLITVEAKPFFSRVWDDMQQLCNVLDCMAMYTVGSRRPDTVAVVSITGS
jgi:hypothetical protein